MDQAPEDTQEADFSAEVIGSLNTEYVFTSHITDHGESQETVMAEMDQIAAGYRDFPPAVAAGKFISLSRFHVYPASFAAMDYVFDQMERLPPLE